MKQSLFIASVVGVSNAISAPEAIPNEILSFESVLSGIDRIAHKEHLLGKPIVPWLSKRAGVAREGDCHDLPDGAAPLPALDTWENFLDYPGYSSLADGVDPPSTYDQAFGDLSGSVSSPSYLGVYTVGAYNPQLCAGYCNVLPSCVAFNIYISRDPSKDIGSDCPNPPATANIKCTLFSSPISAHMATNDGQSQPPADAYGQQFEVKVRASNGYNKQVNGPDDDEPDFPDPIIDPMENSTTIEGFNGPRALSAAISPNPLGGLWIGTQFIQHRYNPSLCARLCNGITKSRRIAIKKECSRQPHARLCAWSPCNYFNSYELINEQTNQAGFYCSLFSQAIPDSAANITQVDYSTGKTFYVANSWDYTRTPEEDNVVTGPAFAANRPPSDLPEVVDNIVQPSAVESNYLENPAYAGDADVMVPSATSIIRMKLTTTVRLAPTPSFVTAPASSLLVFEPEPEFSTFVVEVSPKTAVAVVPSPTTVVEVSSTTAIAIVTAPTTVVQVFPSPTTVIAVSPTTAFVATPVTTTVVAVSQTTALVAVPTPTTVFRPVPSPVTIVSVSTSTVYVQYIITESTTAIVPGAHVPTTITRAQYIPYTTTEHETTTEVQYIPYTTTVYRYLPYTTTEYPPSTSTETALTTAVVKMPVVTSTTTVMATEIITPVVPDETSTTTIMAVVTTVSPTPSLVTGWPEQTSTTTVLAVLTTATATPKTTVTTRTRYAMKSVYHKHHTTKAAHHGHHGA